MVDQVVVSEDWQEGPKWKSGRQEVYVGPSNFTVVTTRRQGLGSHRKVQ